MLVDDDDALRHGFSMVFDVSGFEVAAASNVNDALKFTTTQTFDVLVSGLEMPSPGDGLMVVSAMRHSNLKAITFIFSGYPEMKEGGSDPDAGRRNHGQADGGKEIGAMMIEESPCCRSQ